MKKKLLKIGQSINNGVTGYYVWVFEYWYGPIVHLLASYGLGTIIGMIIKKIIKK